MLSTLYKPALEARQVAESSLHSNHGTNPPSRPLVFSSDDQAVRVARKYESQVQLGAGHSASPAANWTFDLEVSRLAGRCNAKTLRSDLAGASDASSRFS